MAAATIHLQVLHTVEGRKKSLNSSSWNSIRFSFGRSQTLCDPLYRENSIINNTTRAAWLARRVAKCVHDMTARAEQREEKKSWNEILIEIYLSRKIKFEWVFCVNMRAHETAAAKRRKKSSWFRSSAPLVRRHILSFFIVFEDQSRQPYLSEAWRRGYAEEGK